MNVQMHIHNSRACYYFIKLLFWFFQIYALSFLGSFSFIVHVALWSSFYKRCKVSVSRLIISSRLKTRQSLLEKVNQLSTSVPLRKAYIFPAATVSVQWNCFLFFCMCLAALQIILEILEFVKFGSREKIPWRIEVPTTRARRFKLKCQPIDCPAENLRVVLWSGNLVKFSRFLLLQ